jgi:hypothetical protein
VSRGQYEGSQGSKPGLEGTGLDSAPTPQDAVLHGKVQEQGSGSKHWNQNLGRGWQKLKTS